MESIIETVVVDAHREGSDPSPDAASSETLVSADISAFRSTHEEGMAYAAISSPQNRTNRTPQQTAVLTTRDRSAAIRPNRPSPSLREQSTFRLAHFS